MTMNSKVSADVGRFLLESKSLRKQVDILLSQVALDSFTRLAHFCPTKNLEPQLQARSLLACVNFVRYESEP